jgi:hypothetical protein
MNLKYSSNNIVLDNQASYSRASMSGKSVEPLINPSFDLPPRVIVKALNQGK